jgi:predicted nucleotidyltransferase component of viral defense system
MLHYQTIEPDTLGLLKDLMQQPYLNQFVLVGGTALALQIGQRKSVDIDLFTIQDFKTSDLLPNLLERYQVSPILQKEQTLICIINGIKVDFIRFKYPFIRPILEIEGIRMLQIEDIAPMKMDAIAGRGKKKDFYDLYFMIEKFGFERLFALFLEKYPHQTTFHVAKSIAYFADAEKDPDPIVFDKNLSWTKVKNAIKKEIRKL